MGLLLRLSSVITVVFITVFVFSTVHTFQDSRVKVESEVQSTSQIADFIVGNQLAEMAADKSTTDHKKIKQQAMHELNQLHHMQGVIIELHGPDGKLEESSDVSSGSNLHLPAWLTHPLTRFYGQVHATHHPINLGGKNMGEIVIRPDVNQQISSAWNETKTMLMPLVLVFFIGSIFIVFVVSLVLKPVLELVRSTDAPIPEGQALLFPFLGGSELAVVSQKLHYMSNEWQQSSRKLVDMQYRLTQVQEQERKKLSAELHDELGQHLTAIRYDTSAIKSSENLEQAKESATAIDSVSREMTDIVRSMLRRLRPPEIESLGLKGAIVELVGDWEIRHPENQIEFKMSGQNYAQLDDVIQLSTYRVVQECLTNISRHAGARVSVVVSVETSDEHILIRVSDNGYGCDLTQKAAGFGLKGMRERIEGLGGQFEVSSQPTAGMTVKALIPLNKEN